MSSCAEAFPGWRRLSASLLLAAWAVAAEPVQVEATGSVVVDSGMTKRLDAPAKDLLLSWVTSDGRLIGPGEVVFRFDTQLIREQLDDRRRAAAIARIEQEKLVAQRQADDAALESERRNLRAELLTVRASIILAETVDPEAIAVLRAEVAAATLAAEVAQRTALRVQAEAAQGRVSQAEAENTLRQADEARRAIAAPTLRLRLAEQPPEVPVELASLRLRVRDLSVKLGLDADGKEDPSLGIGARIAAAKAQNEADLAARRSDLERIEAELQQSLRDVQDHTPLVGIEIKAEGASDPLARVRFAPAGRKVAEGWTVDHGQVFSDGRGWDRVLAAGELAWREPAAGAAPASGGGKPGSGKGGGGGGKGQGRRPGGSGGGAGGGFTGGVAVLAAPATWSLTVPDGRYSVVLSLGDDREWDGAALAVEGKPLALPARLGPGSSEQRIEVTVADGRLDVVVADGEGKALRSPGSGVVALQWHASVGFKVNDPSWSLGFLAAPEAFMVDALVPQELAPLLAAGRTAAAAGSPLADRIILAAVDLRAADGVAVPAEIVSVGAQSVRYLRGDRDWGSGNPADNTARELRLRPRNVAAMRLVQGASTTIGLHFNLPEGTTALPPHLVRIDRDGAVIRRRGTTEDLPVQAVRLGRTVVIDTVVTASDLVPPPPRRTGPVADAAGRFQGEVIPGNRTRVSLSWLWGKVETLIADGSMVAVGDTVMTVYNPQLDADRPRIERERRAAVQRILAGAERRKQDLVRAQAEHEARIIAETQSRLVLRRSRDDDPAGQRSNAEAIRTAELALAVADQQIARLAAVSQPDQDEVAAAALARKRALLAIERARLGLAAWELRSDWLETINLAGTWSEKVAALARRDAELAEAAIQERINTLSDRIAMEKVAEGDWWQRHFAARRVLKAPVAGRILIQTGWNEQASRSEKIAKEFPVWGGMTVAEIVDETSLRFTAELPEERFPGLQPGTACELEFDVAPGKPIPGVLIELGRAFTLPRDRLQAEDARETVTSRRAFTIVASFTPPEALRRSLPTGAKGWLRIP